MTASLAVPIDRLPNVGEAAVCMGVFDGVHRGHLALLETTITASRERNVRSVALVFDPHPDEVVRPGTVVPRLAPLAENLRRLAAAGIDAPLAICFDPALRALAAEEFLAAMAPAVRVRALVMTPESAFGRNRAGTPDAMTVHGRRAGFDLVLAKRVVEDQGAAISSGRIREAVRVGDLATATRLLGHPAFIEATVAAPGGPAKLALSYPAALPPIGRYRVAVRGMGEGPSSEGILTVESEDIGLEGWSGNPEGGDVLGMDVLEHVG